jgi:putative transposase
MEVKRASSIWAKTRIDARFQWQAGYGAFSVSQSQSNVVDRYIAEQEKHHRRRTFQDEFREFLKKHKLEYDERYVWE